MFACKNCGGNVKFDIKSGQLACDYCHSLFDPYAYEDKTSDAEVQKDFEATIFTCPQCEEKSLAQTIPQQASAASAVHQLCSTAACKRSTSRLISYRLQRPRMTVSRPT